MAALVCLGIALVGAWSVSMARSMGYDEAMHAHLPSARIALALRAGELGKAIEVLLGCQQYPFAQPLLAGLVQAMFGVSEFAARALGRVEWAAALFALFLIVRRTTDATIVDAAVARTRARTAGALAVAMAATSPLGVAYSGSLFLEVPFCAAALAGVHAWLARADGARRTRADLLAGAWIAVALFTKFNYGAMLALGLGVDALASIVVAARARRVGEELRSALRVALPPALACLWWFAWPWPGDFELARSHREAFAGFLAGNQGFAPVSAGARVFDWGAGLFASPRAMGLAAIGVLLSLHAWRSPAWRTLFCVCAALIVPVALHPFHLDRFLLPGGMFLFALAAIGWSRVLPRSAPWRWAAVAALLAAGVVRADLDAPRWLDRCQPTDNPAPAIAEYRANFARERVQLSPGRPLPTAGLPRAESDAWLDRIAAQVGPEERVGWLAAPDKLSPGALHLGLYQRGGSTRRYLEQALDSSMFTVAAVDPAWDDARLASFAGGFDVILSSDPPDVVGRAIWGFLGAYRGRLVASLGWSEVEYATLEFARSLPPAMSVRLYCLRPAR